MTKATPERSSIFAHLTSQASDTKRSCEHRICAPKLLAGQPSLTRRRSRDSSVPSTTHLPSFKNMTSEAIISHWTLAGQWWAKESKRATYGWRSSKVDALMAFSSSSDTAATPTAMPSTSDQAGDADFSSFAPFVIGVTANFATRGCSFVICRSSLATTDQSRSIVPATWRSHAFGISQSPTSLWSGRCRGSFLFGSPICRSLQPSSQPTRSARSIYPRRSPAFRPTNPRGKPSWGEA